MMKHSRIIELEGIAARAWPARESEQLDGWLLRANDGITWRTNTVLPSSPLKTISLDDAIVQVIEYYQSKGIPPAFKVTEASYPENLDSVLEKLSFEKEMQTHFQTADISAIISHLSVHKVTINKCLSQDWISAYASMGGFEEFTLKTRLEIIRRITSPVGLAEVNLDDRIIGIGMGVVESDFLGLFGIYTLPEYRRRGIGQAINIALANWGTSLGAKKAYLQVEEINTGAKVLYNRLGFSTAYNYWYRILRN